MYSVAVKRLRSTEGAKDLVQDLFVSIWLRKETIEIKVSLASYLYTAMKYKIINHIEANILRSNYLSSLNKALLDFDNSTHEKILFNDLEQFMESEIKNLSPKVKEVFELSRKEKLSINEIAQKLNVSEQTVKNQISKAIRTLKLHFNNFATLFISLLIL